MKTDWIRVTRQRLCVICGKPDWCMVAADGSAAICQRIESGKRAGQAGWLHRLTEDRPAIRLPPKRRSKPKLQRNWQSLAAKFHAAMTDDGWESTCC